MPNEPTILVKKTDGSFARLPLAAVRRLKGGVPSGRQPGQSLASLPVQPGSGQGPDLSAKSSRSGFEDPSRSRTTRPSGQSQKALPAPEAVKSLSAPTVLPRLLAPPDDFSDPLDEPLTGHDPKAPLASDSRRGPAEAIVNHLPFALAGAPRERTIAAVALFLKEVRDAAATRATLVRAVEAGGAGLSPEQVATVVARGQEARRQIPAVTTTVVLRATPQALAPYHRAAAAQAKNMVRPAQLTSDLAAGAPPFSLRPAAARETLVDISPPPVTVSPVEEISAFTLTDWRRLSPALPERAELLARKFRRLQEESVLLYLAARRAWRQCPLYRLYLSTVGEALIRGAKLASPTPDPQAINLEEIRALIGVERQLGL